MQTTLVRRVFPTLNICKNSRYCLRNFSSNAVSDTDSPTSDNSSLSTSQTKEKNEKEEFLQLLRNSTFINMGDPTNKIVRGKIFHVVFDNLYIDFGWKFHCVCPKPKKDAELYVRGAEVMLKIKELELSSHFLGIERALTLLESDASIINLIYSPAKKVQPQIT